MTLIIIILVILTGLLLFAVEFLIIPGITIAGIGGFIFLSGGIYYGYAAYGTPGGHYILLATLVTTLGFFFFMLRSKTWKKTMLDTNLDGHIPDIADNNIKIGDRGIAISRLNPIGKIRIDDNFIEAKSQGEFIDEKTLVEVVKVQNTNVIVKPIN